MLVPGELVGVDVQAAGRRHRRRRRRSGVAASRRATPARRWRWSRRGFAEQAGLPTRGTVRVAGGRELRTVGQGTSPEYFLVTRPGGGEFGGAESRFAVLFVPLRVAQAPSAGRTP